jgi:hypothetical protein
VTGCAFSGGIGGKPFVADFRDFDAPARFDEGAGEAVGEADGVAVVEGVGVEAFDALGVGVVVTEAI